MPGDTLNRQLLQQVLAAAEARGMGQARLAEQSGLKAETISRAKKRDDIELGTLSRLAAAVGLQVVLQPATTAPAAARKVRTRPAALSDPRFGLAWSNPQADERVLLRNALVHGRFNAILESAARDGLPFVRAELESLRRSGTLAEAAALQAERMLASIERGFAQGRLHAAA
jgi:DNA-binding phage protein